MTESDTHTQILTAAETRFSLYGYNKTTMAEIAGDCNMSAANLYRYFENKLDIGAALANQCLLEKEHGLELIITDDSMSCADKLRAFVLYVLNYTYHHFDTSPKISELIEAMTDQRPEVMQSHRESKLSLIHQLLEQSQQTGEFNFSNIDQTSEAINTAISIFYLPTVMPMFTIEEFERKADAVCTLLLNGLIHSG